MAKKLKRKLKNYEFHSIVHSSLVKEKLPFTFSDEDILKMYPEILRAFKKYLKAKNKAYTDLENFFRDFEEKNVYK